MYYRFANRCVYCHGNNKCFICELIKLYNEEQAL